MILFTFTLIFLIFQANKSVNDTRYFQQSFITPRSAHGSNQVAAVMRTKWRPDELCAEAEAEYDIFRDPVAVNEPLRSFHSARRRKPVYEPSPC